MNDIDRLILTDCDGCLLNWEFAFNVWMKDKGYKHNPDYDRFKYGIEDRYHLNKEEKKQLILDFNASAAIGFLPPLRDAIHYVRKLHNEHGYIFHCITSLSNDKNAQNLRIMNLEKVFGPDIFTDYVFLGTGEDKDEVLYKYKDTGLYWIEDKFENAVAGRDVGLEPILMEHGHNMLRDEREPDHGDDIPRCENWKQIYELVTGDR